MKSIFFLLLSLVGSCGNTAEEALATNSELVTAQTTASADAGKARHFAGAFSNGMKGDSIFFDISADGKKLENLTFKGYWRCSGKLEQTTVGPDGDYAIKDGKVNDHITEPPGGGSTAWRFDLEANLQGSKASGTFRMNINNLGCDTYKLTWTAVAK
ncbi:MAG: hypothetical protein JWQ96_2912 [Segetibacter sp.]|nr:hypothetical protein [Segetibacter sp.]